MNNTFNPFAPLVVLLTLSAAAIRTLIESFRCAPLGLTREITNLSGRGESENESADAGFDIDDNMEHRQTHGGSFKRPTPVMGNRSLETRNSKRSNFSSQSQKKKEPSAPMASISAAPSPTNSQATVTVGALEVQNVKRAINRYGTLPKGARIGAYLESLRQNTETSASSPSPRASPKELDSHLEPLADLPPPSPAIASAPQASSAANSNFAMSPRAVIKAQPQMIRSNSSGGVTMTNSTQSVNKLQRHRTTTDGTIITFSSFRGTNGSPKRSFNPALADLEFPPPPEELPPPPEEYEANSNAETISTRSTFDALQVSQCASIAPSTDVSNTEPSVEEASSRFGVSLRKRELSTDSCSSLGSPAAGNPGEIQSECVPSEKSKPSPEARDNQERREVKNIDHLALLVSEIAESRNLSKKETPGEAKSKVASKADANSNNFKAQLKKVETKKFQSNEESTNPIVDFKSRLRRVDNSSESELTEANLECKRLGDSSDVNASDSEHHNFRKNSVKMPKVNGNSNRKKSFSDIEMKKTEIKIISDDEKTKADESKDAEEDDDKRKSTGSISSLKKLWETKEGGNGIVGGNESNPSQISPKLSAKSAVCGNNNNYSAKNGDDCDDQVTSAAKKPAVPTKPTKLASIYATPIQVKLTDASNGGSAATATASIGYGTNISSQMSREGILDLVQILETSLKSPINAITASQWLQLSDKLNILQNSCVNYADRSSMAPHSKFQFRELVTRVETQSRSFRSAGSKNLRDNEKLIQDVRQTLKQITNTLHR